MVSVSRDRERERKHPSAHRYHVYAIGFPQSIDHVGAPPRTHARTHTHTHARAHTGIQRQAVALCPCWRRWRRQRQWWWWWCCGCRDAQGEEPGRLVVFNGCPFAFLWYNMLEGLATEPPYYPRDIWHLFRFNRPSEVDTGNLSTRRLHSSSQLLPRHPLLRMCKPPPTFSCTCKVITAP